MKKPFSVLLVALALGILIAVALNRVTVKTIAIGPDGYEEYLGFPFQSCIEFIDLTNANKSLPNKSLHCSYGSVIGNILVALFVVSGVWGNYYFIREVSKKKN